MVNGCCVVFGVGVGGWKIGVVVALIRAHQPQQSVAVAATFRASLEKDRREQAANRTFDGDSALASWKILHSCE